MKILIINSPLFRFKNDLYDEDSLPPLGLGIIATNLKALGYNVELIDAVNERIPLLKLKTIIEKNKPSYIGINIFSTNYIIVKELIESLNIITNVVIGGLATLDLYQKIFKWQTINNIDIIHGDGELIFPDLISGKLLENPKYETFKRRFFEVDSKSKYFANDISNEKLDRTFFKNEPIKHIFGFLEANVITSRGCIYNCSFCAAASSLNKQFTIREKNNESIINEIRILKEIYPAIKSVRILDDLFLKNQNTIDKAINVFKKLDVSWRSMAHIQTFKGVNLETLELLRKSGCNELFIGIESGSPKILKQIHKTSDVDLIKLNITNLFKVGISVKGYFIFGFPNEDESDFQKTYELAYFLAEEAMKFNVKFRTSVFQFRPYHGTELYHNLVQGNDGIDWLELTEPNEQLSELVGRIQFNFHSGNFSNAPIDMVHKYIYLTSNLTKLITYENKFKNEIDKRNSVLSKL